MGFLDDAKRRISEVVGKRGERPRGTAATPPARAGTTPTSGGGTQHPAGPKEPDTPTAPKEPKAPTGPMPDGTPDGSGGDR